MIGNLGLVWWLHHVLGPDSNLTLRILGHDSVSQGHLQVQNNCWSSSHYICFLGQRKEDEVTLCKYHTTLLLSSHWLELSHVGWERETGK